MEKPVTVADILAGCQCAVAKIAGERTTIRCVTCPLHGDPQFRRPAEKGESKHA